MAHGVAKVAISMPRDLFRVVEQVRREMKVPRSAAIVEAIREWLKRREEAEKVRQYIEGYRRHPERLSPGEAKARMKMAADAFQSAGEWE